MQYVYSATQNNGQITQAVDSLSGETVDYAYDSLNRLITAATTGPQWGLSFGYDGFGNRLTQTVTKGSAPASSVSVNASTNRISSSGYGYDSPGGAYMLLFWHVCDSQAFIRTSLDIKNSRLFSLERAGISSSLHILSSEPSPK